MPDILMYTSTSCPYCTMAKRLLEKKMLPYKEINIDATPELREEMQQKTQRRTVPQIYINGFHIGGFDDLQTLDRQHKLDNLLAFP